MALPGVMICTGQYTGTSCGYSGKVQNKSFPTIWLCCASKVFRKWNACQWGDYEGSQMPVQPWTSHERVHPRCIQTIQRWKKRLHITVAKTYKNMHYPPLLTLSSSMRIEGFLLIQYNLLWFQHVPKISIEDASPDNMQLQTLMRSWRTVDCQTFLHHS